MIISITDMREFVPSVETMSDTELRARLEALETLIRKHTNNNFQRRNFRAYGNIRGGKLELGASFFKEGDTIEINNSRYNDGIYVYGEEGDLFDEENVMVTKVVYPKDVVLGAVNLFKWDIEHRDKIGIKTESLSRYSVTYYDMESGSNSISGYPKGLMSFLRPYIKAQF